MDPVHQRAKASARFEFTRFQANQTGGSSGTGGVCCRNAAYLEWPPISIARPRMTAWRMAAWRMATTGRGVSVRQAQFSTPATFSSEQHVSTLHHFTTHHSPLHHSPLTTSPLTTHHSPLSLCPAKLPSCQAAKLPSFVPRRLSLRCTRDNRCLRNGGPASSTVPDDSTRSCHAFG
jgi:hypothetical protein